MDFITYSVSKKLAEAAVSGVDSISAEGSNVIFKCKNGEDITVDIPAPEGVTVTNAYLENSHLFLEFSNGDKYDTGEISLNAHTHELIDLNLAFDAVYDRPVSEEHRYNDGCIPGQPDGIVDVDNLQAILDKKVSEQDIKSNFVSPRDLVEFDTEKAVPSLALVQNFISKLETPSMPERIEVEVFDEGEESSLIIAGSILSDKTYKIVGNEAINTLDSASEMNIALAQTFTEQEIFQGQMIRIVRWRQSASVYPGIGPKFIDKDRMLTSFNTASKPSNTQIYSADILWREILMLRNCIEDLHIQLNGIMYD